MRREATEEQDPAKLQKLVKEISDALEAKKARYKNRRPPDEAKSN
jgi:hypothetical protein